MDPEENVAQGSGSGFRWLILSTVFATYSLIVLGGIVRATESGDACPDWPRCRGELIPPFESAVMIEFSHRLLASVVGFLVLAFVIVAWRTMRNNPTMRWGSVLALVLVIAQAVLGGMTVLSDLSANLVMAHLALASAVLALLVFLAMSVWIPDRPVMRQTRESASFRNLALFAAIATFALMLTGSYVVGSGAGLAFRDWPLFDGQLMPDGGRLAMIHATHRFVAGAIGLLIGYVALQAWRTQRHDQVLVVGSLFAFGLVMLQALMGAVNVWTMLQPAAMASHLALAVLLWTALVTVTLLAHRSVEGSLPHLSKADGPFAPPEALEAQGL
ncbi:MAG: heme A synthase [Chloroflexi bacterium]|nr:heme A synthase [Chloroflexota bacterium]